jgi:Transport and Golgi organisation 2
VCTATFIPLKNNSYLFTHNRDEKVNRTIATLPRRYKMGDGAVVMPVDPISNGTWIATSSCVFSLCILNGGFEFHESVPPYAKSRGQIILDFFKYGDAQKMCYEYDWSGYEPFTFLIVQHINKVVHLFEIVWNGSKINLNIMDATEPHIWSSSTLYTAAEKQKRQQWFYAFVENQSEISETEIIQFHHFVPKDANDEGFIIDRELSGRKTVSLTCIHNFRNENCTFYYKDFIQHKEEKIILLK